MLHLTFSPLVLLLSLLLLALGWENGCRLEKRYIYGNTRCLLLSWCPVCWGLGVLMMFAYDVLRCALTILHGVR